jgi:hypothetical protein
MTKQKASDKIKQMEAQKRYIKYNNQNHANIQHNFYILSNPLHNNYYNSDNNFTTHTTHTTSESNQPFNTFDNVFK